MKQSSRNVYAGKRLCMVPCVPLDRPELTRESPVPLYRQIADWIGAHVDDGRVRPGERLPAEEYLAADWGVSHLTVRHARPLLSEDGKVIRTQGKGTVAAG